MNEYVYCSDGTPLASAGGEISLPRERIVRCRDCKYFKQRKGILPPMVCERWGYYNFKTEPERFCAWAERREE